MPNDPHNSSESDAPKRVVLRARSAIFIFALAALIMVGLSIDAFVRGAFIPALLVLPWFAIILWLIYVLLLRPCVILTPEKLTVVNVFRRHELPWGTIEDIKSRYQLIIVLRNARKIVSWGAPTTGIDHATMRSDGRRFSVSDATRAPGMRSFFARPTPSSATHTLIETLQEVWDVDEVPESTPARSNWEWPMIGVTLLLGALCVAVVLLNR